jgi:hypothetical protein
VTALRKGVPGRRCVDYTRESHRGDAVQELLYCYKNSKLKREEEEEEEASLIIQVKYMVGH